MPRSQGGLSVVENGLPLCGPFAADCHGKKTAGVLKIERGWLDGDQVGWLAEQGWVRWDADGVVSGRGWKHFAGKT